MSTTPGPGERQLVATIDATAFGDVDPTFAHALSGVPEHIPHETHRVPTCVRRRPGEYAFHRSGGEARGAAEHQLEAEDAILARHDDAREAIRAAAFQALGNSSDAAAVARRATLALARKGLLRG